ncbi:MAG: LytR C-terminal domain-containing protein [Myxococcales bacterium]|nr:LytR C-terminal domain-containing protein [Myxococcales bacterium]
MKTTNQASTRRLIVGAGIIAALLISSSALAQPEWDANKGDCDHILQDNTGELAQIRRCIQIWESYRAVSAVESAERDAVAVTMSRLYHQGTESDQRLVQSALARLGARLQMNTQDSTASNSGGDQPRVQRRNREPIHVGESSSRARRRADSKNEDGLDEYRDGDYAAAVRDFESALESDPWHVFAKYNLACNLALLGRHEEALQHLDELSRWDISASSERMARARVDEDFESLRDNQEFKLITGYAVAQILNGAGAPGLNTVTALRESMEGDGFQIDSFGYDRHTRMRSAIYYQPGLQERAEDVQAMIGSPETVLRPIDWDTEYDIIVTYGDPEAATAARVPRPLVQGTFDGTIVSGDPEATGEDAVEAGEDAVDIIEDPSSAPDAVQEWMPGM